MRRVKAQVSQGTVGVHRVVQRSQLMAQWEPSLRFLLKAEAEEDVTWVNRLPDVGIGNVGWITSSDVMAGDVVAPAGRGEGVVVLNRPSDLHHGLQLTNRCNSYCLMCSQPPTPQADDWMVTEALDVLRHISKSPPVIGFSGGEPLLLGPALRQVFDTVADVHPTSSIELLTNGRLLADQPFARALVEGLRAPVSWLVPLYGHADFLHDFVVQAPGAFEQTLEGLLNLQRLRQPVQLRIVLIEPVLESIVELCEFIGRNLPFVREVALMACEPIGFALANKDICETDLREWHGELEAACRQLHRYQVPFLFMNTPLCALPSRLHGHAHRSISDWKNVYTPECDGCAMRRDCSGFFTWHDKGWKPMKTIKVIEEVTL